MRTAFYAQYAVRTTHYAVRTMDVRIGKFKTKDGLELHYEQWCPLAFKANLVFVHGMGDHCGRYGPFVDYFTKRGYRVFLYDQRGHGKSQGKRVFVKDFDCLLEDLLHYTRFSLNGSGEGTPSFLVGHSFGGQIALNFLSRYTTFFQAACCSSPSLQIVLTMPKWMEMLGRVMLPIWPGMKLKNLTNPDLLSHDPKIIEDYKKDPLISDYVTIGIGSQMFWNLEAMSDWSPKIKTPMLLLHGSQDQYCSVEGTKRLYQELRLENKRLRVYEGMYHELLNETEKENVYQEMENWFSPFARP